MDREKEPRDLPLDGRGITPLSLSWWVVVGNDSVIPLLPVPRKGPLGRPLFEKQYEGTRGGGERRRDEARAACVSRLCSLWILECIFSQKALLRPYSTHAIVTVTGFPGTELPRGALSFVSRPPRPSRPQSQPRPRRFPQRCRQLTTCPAHHWGDGRWVRHHPRLPAISSGSIQRTGKTNNGMA